MRTLALVSLTGLLAATAPATKDSPVKKEVAKLAGTWVVSTVESNGRSATDDELEGLRYVFTADGAWKLQKATQTLAEGTYKLDPAKKPKTIDYQIVKTIAAQDKGKTSLGIYELAGDRLKVCRTWPENEERPGDFSAGPGSKRILTEFKRQKDGG